MLDDVEETFDEVALAREREVALARRLAICPRRNDGLDAADFEMLDEAVAIIAFVGEEGRGFDFLGQDLGLRYVVNMSAGEAHRQRIARRIDYGVNLGRQIRRASGRSLRSNPLFSSPGAVLMGLAMDASIMAYSLSGSSAKVLSRLSQTPLSAHRENRLLFFQSPKCSGRSRQGAPVRNFQMTANSRLPLSPSRPILEANIQFVQIDRHSMHSVSKAASIKKAPMNHASRGYRTRRAMGGRRQTPLLFEQRLDDRPLLVGQVHARPVRPVDHSRL